MKRVAVALILMMAISTAAVADDLYSPPWERFVTPNTTYAHWDGWLDWNGEYLADNEYTQLSEYASIYDTDQTYAAALMDSYAGRYDVLHIPEFGELTMNVPNYPNDNDRKEVYLQITWQSPDDDLWVEATEPPGGITEEWLGDTYLANGWIHSYFHYTIVPNPDYEQFVFAGYYWGNIYIDQIVVDTICVPEPASLALLALGGLVLIRRR